MEFESLTRKELQTLCKKNKIPANITNVAMIEALKALDFIDGIEELQQGSQSEIIESSIDSPEKLEATTPAVPRTGGRTTRRRTVPEPETLVAATRTRRTTRKTLADATETPAVVQTVRNKVPTSVCRKMDAQLKECADEEKGSGILVTPAPSGVTTRRRGAVVKEETVVTTRAYSTRRSVRSTAKKVEAEKEKSDLITKDDGESATMNLKEGLDAMDETTGFEEEKDEQEVASVEKHSEEIGEESKLVIITNDKENLEENYESEPMNVQDDSVDSTYFAPETEMKMDDGMVVESEIPNGESFVIALENEAQETNGYEGVEDDDVDSKLEVKEDDNNLEYDDTCYSSKTKMEMDEDNLVVESEIPKSEIPLENEVQETSNESQVVEVLKTDNKENTGSNVTKENEKLDDLSLRKLCKMLKQKLEITNKLPKCETGEAVHARTALQILPENRMGIPQPTFIGRHKLG